MKTKIISIALSLAACSVVMATEFKAPEFNDDYKVEGAVKTDRGIASEKESEREPSSVVAMEKKKPVVMPEDEKTNDEKFEPKPWLYKNKLEKDH
jgi:hypothetical protein